MKKIINDILSARDNDDNDKVISLWENSSLYTSKVNIQSKDDYLLLGAVINSYYAQENYKKTEKYIDKSISYLINNLDITKKEVLADFEYLYSLKIVIMAKLYGLPGHFLAINNYKANGGVEKKHLELNDKLILIYKNTIIQKSLIVIAIIFLINTFILKVYIYSILGLFQYVLALSIFIYIIFPKYMKPVDTFLIKIGSIIYVKYKRIKQNKHR